MLNDALWDQWDFLLSASTTMTDTMVSADGFREFLELSSL